MRNGCLVDSNLLTSLIQGLFIKVGVNNLGINRYRQCAISFMEKNLRSFKDFDNLEEDEEDEELSDLYDFQAAHSRTVALSNYAVSSHDSRLMHRDALQNFYLCSISWQTLLGK